MTRGVYKQLIRPFIVKFILCMGGLFSGQPLKPFKGSLSVARNSIVRHWSTFNGQQ
jgi:hypothetical protein